MASRNTADPMAAAELEGGDERAIKSHFPNAFGPSDAGTPEFTAV